MQFFFFFAKSINYIAKLFLGKVTLLSILSFCWIDKVPFSGIIHSRRKLSINVDREITRPPHALKPFRKFPLPSEAACASSTKRGRWGRVE